MRISMQRKKELVRILVGAAVLTMMLGLSAAAFAASNNAVENAQYGVVRVIDVIKVYKDGSFDYSAGTGFVVNVSGNKYIIATNHHVVEENPENVFVTITDIDNCLWAEVLYANETTDIAILKVSGGLSGRRSIKSQPFVVLQATSYGLIWAILMLTKDKEADKYVRRNFRRYDRGTIRV